jgi:hypothetical protein
MSNICQTYENDFVAEVILEMPSTQNAAARICSNGIDTENPPVFLSFPLNLYCRDSNEATPVLVDFWQILPDSSSQFSPSACLKKANRP